MGLKFLGFLLASVGAIIGLTVGVGFVTLRRWLLPLEPALYLASVLVVLFAVMAAAWVVVTQRELASGIGAEGESAEERGLKRLVLIAIGVITGVLSIGLMGTWALGEVRARFIPFVGDSYASLKQPLADQSPHVRKAACEEIFRRGWAFRAKGDLMSAMNTDPESAHACIQTAQSNEWKGGDIFANSLAEGWEAQLMSPEAEPAAMCTITPWLAGFDTLAGNNPTARLLRCTASAGSDDIRLCCANELAKGGDLHSLVSGADELEEQVDGKVFGTLVRYAYRPLSLPDKQQAVVNTLQMDDEKTRRWLAALGCGKLDPTKNQSALIDGFFPLVESRTCPLTAEQQIEYTAPAAWVRLCSEIADAPTDEPIEKAVCESVVAAKIDKSVAEAKLRVWEAIRAPFMQESAQFVTSGVVRAERMGSGGGRKAEYVRKKLAERDFILSQSVNDWAARMDRNDQPGCYRRDLSTISSNTTEQTFRQSQPIWTIDCESMDNRTLGQLIADRNQTLNDLADGKGIESGPDRKGVREKPQFEKAKKMANDYMKKNNINGMGAK